MHECCLGPGYDSTMMHHKLPHCLPDGWPASCRSYWRLNVCMRSHVQLSGGGDAAKLSNLMLFSTCTMYLIAVHRRTVCIMHHRLLSCGSERYTCGCCDGTMHGRWGLGFSPVPIFHFHFPDAPLSAIKHFHALSADVFEYIITSRPSQVHHVAAKPRNQVGKCEVFN